MIKVQFFNDLIEFDMSTCKLRLNSNQDVIASLVDTTMLIEALKNGKIFSPIKIKDDIKKELMYYAIRSLYVKEINNTTWYLDFVIYPSNITPVFNGFVRRSNGHWNDINELELHQVISGEVMVLFISKDDRIYIDSFFEGDYFEVPKGWYHCTYIPNDELAIVANIYCKAYWENNIDLKPYFESECVTSIIYQSEKVLSILKRGVVIDTIDLSNLEKTDTSNYLSYGDISKEQLHIVKYPKSILDLFRGGMMFND